ncbi:unnamed protein product [Owenia fusiformis]|uniref:Lengsin n=1 Tax=Owenia fusiformis TaxID=6347 RepID=A0A8J1Y2N1_OWEFU|nr:unnamed protein product [Owenia fusiformis]
MFLCLGCGRYKVGEVICEPHWKEDGSYQKASPRYVARKQLDRLSNMGFSVMGANEFEFQVLNEKTLEPVFEGMDVFTSVVMATQESLLYEIDGELLKAGVDTETYQTECGPGQFEITMRPVKDMKIADSAFILKNGVKEICQKRGLLATFMSKPSSRHQMNGTHFNHSVWDCKGKNPMYDPTKDDNLSEFAGHWIGGLVKHSRAITALCCPTVNCYHRIGQRWCPDIINWGIMNRHTLFRVKNTGESGTYVENRLPSGACNSYLVMAATLAAGIDGVLNKIPRPKEADKGGEKLPQTLSEAITALKEDSVLCEGLGEEFVDWFTRVKQECEIDPLGEDKNEDAYPAEREMYMKLM